MDIFLNGLKNWKTTLLGIIGLITTLVTQADLLAAGTNTQRIQIVTTAIGVFFSGLFAKDADKTGVIKQDIVLK